MLRKFMLIQTVVAAFCAASTFAQGKATGAASPGTSAELQNTRKDIRNTLGTVPTFLQQFPQDALPGAWMALKSLEFNPNTSIPDKYKSLISLGVAAQVPCNYCVQFDTEAAKMGGASEQEKKEALAMAALTRHWSTVLNGNQINYDTFRGETDRIIEFVRTQTQRTPAAEGQEQEQAQAQKPALKLSEIDTAEEAYTDIEQTWGFVPEFLRSYPREAIAGAWREMKTLQMSDKTAIPGKYKELVGLAVSSQVPCTYCVYFHTQAAKYYGATEQEIKEAVAIAAQTRHWSTYMNGLQLDPKQFGKEVRQIMGFMKQQQATKRKPATEQGATEQQPPQEQPGSESGQTE